MNIFLTGGTGFIGKALLKKLVSKGFFVKALARSEEGGKEMEALGAQAVIGSLEKAQKDWLSNIDVVYHLGAIRYEWGFSPYEYQKVNVEATQKLLEYSLSNRAKHFILGSTVFVFGSPKKIPIDESYPYAPESQYAQSKAEAEKLVKKFGQKTNLQTTILRPTITYGPGDTKGMLLKLCHLIEAKKFILVGNGKNLVHLTHIDDVVNGFALALESKKKESDYIIASSQPIPLENLVKIVSQELGKKIWPGKIPIFLAKTAGLIFESFYHFGKFAGGTTALFRKEPLVTRSKVNILTGNRAYAIKKASQELRYNPQTDYPEGIKRTIQWYKQNGFLST
jgi:nucleoside-diphosphate-sugar epimerase